MNLLNLSESDSLDLVNQHGGIQSDSAFKQAAAMIVKEQKKPELKNTLTGMVRGNVNIAAMALEEMNWRDELANDGEGNIVKELLDGREATEENFLALAKEILQ